MTTDIVTQPEAQVPDLAQTPALDIDADDVALPRIYLGQFSSEAVQDERVKPGDIFTALTKDDPDPVVIWDRKKNKAGPVFHVFALKKGKSVSREGQLELYDFNDPAAPEDSWVTYNYVVGLPEVDPEVPYKWLLTRSGRPAAQQINMVLKKNEHRGPVYERAFSVTTDERDNEKGRFFVPLIHVEEPKPENVEIAAKLATIISGNAADIQATGVEPAI